MFFTPKIEKAIIKAIKLHHGQRRKVDRQISYIVHPITVAIILSHYTISEDIIVAAFIHDAIEDTSYTLKELEQDFGKNIKKIVEEISEEKGKEDRRATWLIRKKKYLEHLKKASFEAKMICAADKIHNLRSIILDYEREGEKIWQKFNAPKEKKFWFYREVLKILKSNLKNPIVKELESTFKEAQEKLLT